MVELTLEKSNEGVLPNEEPVRPALPPKRNSLGPNGGAAPGPMSPLLPERGLDRGPGAAAADRSVGGSASKPVRQDPKPLPPPPPPAERGG